MYGKQERAIRSGVEYREDEKIEQEGKYEGEVAKTSSPTIPEIEKELSMQSEAAEKLFHVISLLAEKLGPVLSLENPEKCSDAESQDLTPIGRLIRGNSDKVNDSIKTIQDLIERVEV